MQNIIYGKCPSKSNCYKVITLNGHGSIAKQPALKDYEQSFYMQCKLRNQMISSMFELHLDVYHENNRPDLDNAFKVVLDCLQSCKAIKNDRYCVKIVGQKFIDKKNPRIEFDIIEIK